MARQRLIQWSAGVLVLGLTVGAVTVHMLQQSASAGAAGSPQAKPEPHPAVKVPTVDERRPLGTWERSAGPVHITLTCTPERLEGLIVVKLKEEKTTKLTIDFRADYSVTRDNVLYGVVTSAGIRSKTKGDVEDQAFLEQALVDQPFSFRFRLDDDILTMKDLRFHLKREEAGDLKDIEAEILAVGSGRYTRKAGIKAPAASLPRFPE